jgi:hypothetical protein
MLDAGNYNFAATSNSSSKNSPLLYKNNYEQKITWAFCMTDYFGAVLAERRNNATT